MHYNLFGFGHINMQMATSGMQFVHELIHQDAYDCLVMESMGMHLRFQSIHKQFGSQRKCRGSLEKCFCVSEFKCTKGVFPPLGITADWSVSVLFRAKGWVAIVQEWRR